MDNGAILGRRGVGGVHHGDHGDAEVDTETVDHGEAEEHEDSQAEASRTTLGRNCPHTQQKGPVKKNVLFFFF